MKPIIVLGKGPSAFEVSPNNKVDVATANNTIWLCKNPTYAFFNDIELFWLCKKEDFKDVKNIVVPSYLHSHWAKEEGIVDGDLTHFYQLSKLFPNWFDHVDFSLYELHAGDNSKQEEKERTGLENSGVPSLDEWPESTGGTAVSYLSKFLGYRDFILAGFDVEGGYHPKFIGGGHPKGEKGFNGQGTAAQPSHLYQNNWDVCERFAGRYGGTVRHINDISEEERLDLGI